MKKSIDGKKTTLSYLVGKTVKTKTWNEALEFRTNPTGNIFYVSKQTEVKFLRFFNKKKHEVVFAIPIINFVSSEIV